MYWGVFLLFFLTDSQISLTDGIVVEEDDAKEEEQKNIKKKSRFDLVLK